MGHKADPRVYRAFFILGLAFLPIGLVTSPAFLAIGVTFFVIGLAGMTRNRRSSRKEGS